MTPTLVNATYNIKAVSAGSFHHLRAKGQRYEAAYLEPVTAGGLQQFLE